MKECYFVILECFLQRSDQISSASILTLFHGIFDTSTILRFSQKFITIKILKQYNICIILALLQISNFQRLSLRLCARLEYTNVYIHMNMRKRTCSNVIQSYRLFLEKKMCKPTYQIFGYNA